MDSNKKVITDKLLWFGKEFKLRYWDLDSFSGFPYEKCRQVYGVCFYKNKIVISRGGKLGKWSLIGGTIEKGETFEETLSREVREESNMKVLKCLPIGTQEVTAPDGMIIYQLRYCASVEPIGVFEKDPAGSVIEIKLIDPKDYKKYFDWGKIGDRIMTRALSLREGLKI